MTYSNLQHWGPTFIDPSTTRLNKPRQHGLTMIIDKGLGLANFKDILQTASTHIDFIKLGFGTSALYPQHILQKKIQWANEYEVSIYPGGTFFEVAYAQGRFKKYLQNALDWGFTTIEISDGSISLSFQERREAIHQAKEMNFSILTECGKKANGSMLELSEIEETLYSDLECGAEYMIVEGRESGKNVGIYDSKGEIDRSFIEDVQTKLGSTLERMIWEAPQKQQQVTLIQSFGANVNLGNIAVGEIYSLESLRRGLRSDTFFLGQ